MATIYSKAVDNLRALNREHMSHHTDSVEAAEEIARTLSQSIRYSCGKGQYDAQPDCQAAYLDGVETAIAMMYIDLTGGHKSKGILGRLFATTSQQVEEAVKKERERVISALNEALLTKTQYREFASGWGKEGSDRNEGYVTGAMDVNGRVIWALAGVGMSLDMGVTPNHQD